MGSTFEATCDNCGLHTYGSIGGGMEDFKIFAAWPCLCRSCEAVTTANTLAEDVVCLKCKSRNITLYDDLTLSVPGGRQISNIDWGQMTLDTSRFYLCPSCVNFSLKFQHGNRSWD
jgi:Zn finger protein HypA/HybF involved in hydrogenase expression